MLSLDDFKPVTLEDKEFFRQFYARYPQVHSDNTFTNMVCWNHFANYSYAKVNGNVVLASTIDGKTHFRPPIGPQNPALLKDLLRLTTRTEEGRPIILIDPATADWMQSLHPRLEVIADRDQSEYVYQATDLAGLQGRNYLYIRRDINKFKRNHTYSVEPIAPENSHHVKDFLDQWYASRSHEDGSVASQEREAVLYGLDYMAETGFSGLTINVDGKICAMSMFERLNPDTALIHFEKGLPEYDGIYKVINQETAIRLSQEFTYINRESDMGVPGLREAKMRYHPHHMVEVYTASMPKPCCKIQCFAKRMCGAHCTT